MTLATKQTDQSSNLSNLKNLEPRMNQEIIDQTEAVKYVAQMIQTDAHKRGRWRFSRFLACRQCSRNRQP